jgi:hypothetical protein
MVQNILIEFSSDTRGITTAEQAVQQFDKAGASAFAKTNEGAKEADKNYRTAASTLKDFTDKVNNAGKAAAGAFGTKALTEMQAAISKTLKDTVQGFNLSEAQARKFFKSIQDEAKKGLLKGGTAQEIKELQASLNAATEALKELGEGSDETSGKTQSLKAQLRAMKEELATIDDPSNPRFIQLSSEAAELEDRVSDVNQQIKLLSSDTRGLDASIQLIGGLAGGFAAAQGAMALFGDENGQVQQTLLKVNAAMAILQGLQQVGAILDKNSALNIFLIKNLRLQQAAATTATATAEGEATVATGSLAAAEGEATAATISLNAAMAANPAGVVLLAIAGLVTIFAIFTKSTKEAVEEQERLNDALDRSAGALKAQNDAIKQGSEERMAQLKKDRASSEAIRDEETSSIKKQLEKTRQFVNDFRGDFFKAARDLGDENLKLSKEEADKKIAFMDQYKAAQNQEAELRNQLEIKTIDNESEAFKERLKNYTAFVEAKALKQKEGSRNELVAQIAAIRAREQEELQSASHLPGEIARIQAQANRDVAKLNQDIRLFDLNQHKLLEDAKLQKSKEGSKEELDAKLKIIDVEKKEEIVKANGNTAKLLDIDAAYFRKKSDLIKDYNNRIVEEVSAARIAEDNSRISQLQIEGARANNDKLLEAKKKLVEDQAQAEILSIQQSTDTEERKRVRIQSVYDKELTDKKQLERDKISAEINSQLNFLNAADQLQIDRAQRVLGSTNSTYAQRQKALEKFYKYSFDQIDNEQRANEESFDNSLISYEDYLTKKLELQDKSEALSAQKTKQVEEEKQAIIQASLQLLSTSATGYFSNLKQAYDNDLAAVQELQQKKLITDAAATKEIRKIKKKEAQLDKEQALFNIALQTAENVVKYFANPVLIGLALTTGAIEAGFVLTKQIPAYKKGKIRIDGPGNETSDSIVARLSKNESVINAAATKKYQPALEAINSMKFEEYIANLPTTNIPQMAALPKWANSQLSSNVRLDAKEVGAEVAKAIEKMPQFGFSFDERGAIAYMINQGNMTEFLNKKYSFRK